MAIPSTEAMAEYIGCECDTLRKRVAELERERDEARAAIAGILTPQLRAILTEDPCVPGAVTGGHDRDDIVIVGRIGFGRLKRALDALTGGT